LAVYTQWNGTLQQTQVKTYICPSDPTITVPQYQWVKAVSSYGFNAQVFTVAYPWGWGAGFQRFPASIVDGTSNTIFFMDKEIIESGNPNWSPDEQGNAGTTGAFGLNFWPDWGPALYSPESNDQAGAPQQGNPNLTQGNWGGINNSHFQVKQQTVGNGSPVCTLPPWCSNGNLGSSPHTAGINVGLGDGSVRFVTQGVSTQTWWFAITPNMGDILGSDW
jgi:hypothetical protein